MILPWQNGPRWQIGLHRDDGTRIATLGRVGAFRITHAINNYGAFSMILPASFDKSLIQRDRRVRFWRKPVGGAPRIEFEGLIRKWDYATDASGNLTRVIGGPSLEYILSSRIVYAASGSAGAAKTDAADDLLKAFAAQELSTGSDAARNLSTAYFTVQGDASLGPSLTKTCSYGNLLTVMREIVDAARQADPTKEVFFWIEPGVGAFQLRTAIGQPGADRTVGNKLVFGVNHGNLQQPRYSENWMEEYNYAYALGLGEGAARDVDPASDSRGLATLFARREATIQHNYATGGEAAAQSKVTQGRPVKAFSGKLVSKRGSVYGRDWGKFDRVRVDYDDMQFQALVRSVTIDVAAGGAENIAATAEAYL